MGSRIIGVDNAQVSRFRQNPYEASYQYYRTNPNGNPGFDQNNYDTTNTHNTIPPQAYNRIQPNIQKIAETRKKIDLANVSIGDVEKTIAALIKDFTSQSTSKIVFVDNTFAELTDLVSTHKGKTNAFVDVIREVVARISIIATTAASLVPRVDYYKTKLAIKRQIEDVIRINKAAFLEQFTTFIQQAIDIPSYKEDYLSGNQKIYIGAPNVSL